MAQRYKIDPETGERMIDPETGERILEEGFDREAEHAKNVSQFGPKVLDYIVPSFRETMATGIENLELGMRAKGKERDSLLAESAVGTAMAPMASASQAINTPFRLAGSLIPGLRGKRSMEEAARNPNGTLLTTVPSEFIDRLPEPSPKTAAGLALPAVKVAKAGAQAVLGMAEGGLVSGTVGATRFALSPKARAMSMANESRITKAAAKISSAINKISDEAILKASTAEGRKALAGAASARGAIGDGLNDLIRSASKIPEEAVVEAALPKMKPINPKSVLDAMEEARQKAAKQFEVMAGTDQRGQAIIVPEGRIKPTEVLGPEQTATVGTFSPGRELMEQPGPGAVAIPSGQSGLETSFRRVNEVNTPYVAPTVKGSSVSGGTSKLGGTGTVDQANAAIDDLMGRIRRIAGEDPHTGKMADISAADLNAIRKQYDAKVDYNKDYSEMVEAVLKAGRAEIARLERASAKASGLGDEFIGAMDAYHAKLNALDNLKARMGWNERTRSLNPDAITKNLFGPDKRATRETIAELDRLFGKNFIEQAKLEDLAMEFGPSGVPGLMPKDGSAAAALSALAGGGLVHAAGPAAGLTAAAGFAPAAAFGSLASPKIATEATIPAIRATRGVMRLSPSLPVKLGLAGSLAPGQRQE